MSLDYTRVNWKDYPDTSTPQTAANLNIMDKGISDIIGCLKDNGVNFKFGYDGTNYGYYKNGSNTITPFKNPTGNIDLAGNASGADVANYATATVKHTGERTSSFTSNGRKDLGESHNYRYININVPSTPIKINNVEWTTYSSSGTTFTKELSIGHVYVIWFDRQAMTVFDRNGIISQRPSYDYGTLTISDGIATMKHSASFCLCDMY